MAGERGPGRYPSTPCGTIASTVTRSAYSGRSARRPTPLGPVGPGWSPRPIVAVEATGAAARDVDTAAAFPATSAAGTAAAAARVTSAIAAARPVVGAA